MYWFLSRFPTKIQLLSILRLGIRFVALTTGCVREYVKSKAGLLIKDFFGAFIPVDFLGAKKQKVIMIRPYCKKAKKEGKPHHLPSFSFNCFTWGSLFPHR
jgi:hypothetical protein